MPAYRTYLIDQTNNISGPAHWTICAGDFDAIEKAKQLVDGHDVELWESDRLVMRFFATQEKLGVNRYGLNVTKGTPRTPVAVETGLRESALRMRR